jgi:hypothetical protein
MRSVIVSVVLLLGCGGCLRDLAVSAGGGILASWLLEGSGFDAAGVGVPDAEVIVHETIRVVVRDPPAGTVPACRRHPVFECHPGHGHQ